MERGVCEQRAVLGRAHRRLTRRPLRRWFTTFAAAVAVVAGSGLAGGMHGQTPRFRVDDPLAREPETQDASKAAPYEINLGASLLMNMFAAPRQTVASERAGNVNTIDEVPDSSWFTNRVYAAPITLEALARGPNVIDGPRPGRWTVIGAKTSGAAPGFRVRDEAGEIWFLTLDPKESPRAATAAIAVASRLFWALGYFQIESYLSSFRPEDLQMAPDATIETRENYERAMKLGDLDGVLRRAARNADGTYRVLAARAAPGKILGGFRYTGTRPDDPNDIVPHENRREIRALKVFGAWTNLVDLKALNTLDSVVIENGRGIVRHYLQDVGSTFGTGANGPHDWQEGHEYLYEGDPIWKRLVTFGFYLRPWQYGDYVEHPEIGRIAAGWFDPEQWKPRVPIVPISHARTDDTFWAALRVAAFTDDMIRTAVHEGQYSDPAAERILTDVLIDRRNKIAKAYLPKLTPLVRFALDDELDLTFENAAVRVGAAPRPAGGYRAAWFAFDNATGATLPLGETTSREEQLSAPESLRRGPDAQPYVKVAITASDPNHTVWSRPVDVYFRRTGGGWQLVGVDRAVD